MVFKRTIVALAGLLLVGLLLGASMLVYASYVVAAVFLLSQFLTRTWTQSLTASRNLSADEMEVGDSAAVRLSLHNTSRLPIVWALVEDLLPAKLLNGPSTAIQLSGTHFRVVSIPAGSGKVIVYQIKALRRGYFQLGPVVAETGDLLGLYKRFNQITDASYLTVLPKLIPLDGYDIASKRPIGEVKVSYRLMEDPTLISGIRQYRTGDPIRSIHWRASARTGELQCKQFEPTSVAGATLVLDMHRDTNPDEHEPIRTDLAVTAAASICHALLQIQQQFGLISNGRDAVDRISELADAEAGGKNESGGGQEEANDRVNFDSLESAKAALAMRKKSERLRPVVIPYGRGPEHFQTIHRTLARLERTDGAHFEDLLLEVQSRLPRDATVLVILQNVTEEAAMALGELVRQGYSVAAIVNNYENEALHVAIGRLLSYRIAAYHLHDEQSIPEICKAMVLKY